MWRMSVAGALNQGGYMLVSPPMHGGLWAIISLMCPWRAPVRDKFSMTRRGLPPVGGWVEGAGGVRGSVCVGGGKNGSRNVPES